MPEITINERKITVDEGTTILEAARSVGIQIPTLCNLEHHPAQGACRVCVVEVEGARTLQASCATRRRAEPSSIFCSASTTAIASTATGAWTANCASSRIPSV